MLTVIDEFTRRCLAIIVARRLRSDDVLHCLAELFVPTDRLSIFGLTMVPSSSPERARVARPDRREDALHRARQPLGERLLRELQFQSSATSCWRVSSSRRCTRPRCSSSSGGRHYNAIRPHSSLGYRPPAPETILPPASAMAYAALRPAQTLATSGRTLT
jgi:transposase InsO family protein